MDIPAGIKNYITPVHKYPQPVRWLRLLASPGSMPSYALTPASKELLANTLAPNRTALLSFLHAHKLHIYCYCHAHYPAISHIKQRDDLFFASRNPHSPEHHSHCALFHFPPAPADASDEVTVDEPPLVLGLHKATPAILGAFFHDLIITAGRDKWVPGSPFLSASDWVEASHNYQLAPGIPLSWFFKGRQQYQADLASSLKRREKDWPEGVPAHGVVYIQPDAVDIPTRTLSFGDEAVVVDAIHAFRSEKAQSGLLVIDAEGHGLCAYLSPCAGKKHDIPLNNEKERSLCAYLMRTLSGWHSNDKYLVTLTLQKPWPVEGRNPPLANFIVSHPERGSVPILMLTGELDDSLRKRAFLSTYVDQGFVFDATGDYANTKIQEKLLNERLFYRLVAKAQS